MLNLKRQKGNVLVIITLFMTTIAFYLSLHAENQAKDQKSEFVAELREQLDSYLYALDLYGKTFCAADGVIDENDIFPAFSSVNWMSPFNSNASFNIDNATGMRSIILTFNDATHYDYLANINWVDINVTKDPASNELTFTHGRENAPSHGRANYNRNLFLSTTPNGC